MSRIKKEILNKLKEYAGKMGRDHLGGDDIESPRRGGLRDFDGYDNVDYNRDMPMDEAYIVLYSPKKGVKPVATAAYRDKKDAEKWAKDLGGITMIVKKKVKGVDEAKLSTIHKAAKKGSYPVSLVVIKNGKVIKQVLNIKTPAEVPAAFNVVKNYHKHKDATVHIEDRTGKRLFSEAKVNYNFSENELKRVLKLLGRNASTEVKMIKAFEKAFGRKLTRDELFESVNEGMFSSNRPNQTRFKRC